MKKFLSTKWGLLVLLFGVLAPGVAMAGDDVSAGVFTANNVWMMLSAGLVFIMHLGFATLRIRINPTEKCRKHLI